MSEHAKLKCLQVAIGPAWAAVIVAALFSSRSTLAQSAAPVALYATDALGRSVPGPADVRSFSNDRYVGIFYFLWLRTARVYDCSKILADNPDAASSNASPPWGPPRAYHFWGQPLFGYYRSDDPWVLRRHAALLSDAGVDFLVMDTTNAVIYEPVVRQLCEVFDRQREAGDRVPKITFMVNTRAGQTAQRIYETFYKPGRYSELWFRFRGKPLLICDPADASEEVASYFTLRKAHWPFQLVNTRNAWHWEATYPQVYSYDEDPANPEQVNVSVGQNLHQDTGRVEMMSTGKARGRSFHQGHEDPRPEAYRYGLNFQEQWQRAHELDPEVVFVTGWNEWIAMQLNTKPGRPVFCDQFNLEYSRDVEMMRGGYGDNYYLQLAANVRQFKGMTPSGIASSEATIDIGDSFQQWKDVGIVYRDHPLDTLPRDFPGCGDHHYRVASGRNDFCELKVTHDDENVYFYCRTKENLSSSTDANWMWLLIDVAGTESPNWEGFRFIVNRLQPQAETASFEVCTGGWQWEKTGRVRWRAAGTEMHVAVPRDQLGIEAGPVSLDFKWIDNIQKPGEILDLYTNGDTAPDGRFRYRYEMR